MSNRPKPAAWIVLTPVGPGLPLFRFG